MHAHVVAAAAAASLLLYRLNPHRVPEKQLRCEPNSSGGRQRLNTTTSTTATRGMRMMKSVCRPLTPPATSVPCLRTRPRRQAGRSEAVNPRWRSTDLWWVQINYFSPYFIFKDLCKETPITEDTILMMYLPMNMYLYVAFVSAYVADMWRFH